jgi:hypothetical protein
MHISLFLFLKSSFGIRLQEPRKVISGDVSDAPPTRSNRLLLTSGQRTFTRQEITGNPVCGDAIPDLANATWAYTARDGSVVTYTCNVGFVTSQGGTQFNYTCSPGEPIIQRHLTDSCSIVHCERPAPLENSDLIWTHGPSVGYGRFGDVVDYACHVGYSGDGRAHGPRTVKQVCTASGDFQFVLGSIASCLLIHCDVPLALPNAQMDPLVDKTIPVIFNSSVAYTCSPGYVSSLDRAPGFRLTCSDSGEFVPNDPLPRCVNAACPNPPVLPHATTLQVSGTVAVGDRVIYRCEDGYTVSQIPASSTFNLRCDVIGGRPMYVIPPPESQCKPAQCLPLPALYNAHVTNGYTAWHYQQVAHFECDAGYSLGSVKGETTFDGYCNTQGIWSLDDDPKCAPVTCAATVSEIPKHLIAYARMSPFPSEPIQFNMNTTVTCIGGAVVTGTGQSETSFTLECGPDGDLSSEGVCAVPCPPLPKVSHSTSAYFNRIIEYGDPPATIKCKPGYTSQSGEVVQEVTCSRDGTLSPIEACVFDHGYRQGSGENSDFEYQSQEHILRDAELIRKSSAPVLHFASQIIVPCCIFALLI